MLLEEIFLAFGLKSMLVSPYALREGVIVNTLAETFASYQPGVNVRSSSIHNLALKFNTGRRMESAQHSALLAKVSHFSWYLVAFVVTIYVPVTCSTVSLLCGRFVTLQECFYDEFCLQFKDARFGGSFKIHELFMQM